jgi:hypothetical protein
MENNPEVEKLSVANINGGRLAAHINEHINDVMEDVIDPNKPATARREITVTIGFVPSKSRREAKIEYKVTAKLAGMEKEESFCNVRKIGGKAVASVEHIEQQELTFTSEEDSAS